MILKLSIVRLLGIRQPIPRFDVESPVDRHQLSEPWFIFQYVDSSTSDFLFLLSHM